jgi:hypothetical protein
MEKKRKTYCVVDDDHDKLLKDLENLNVALFFFTRDRLGSRESSDEVEF